MSKENFKKVRKAIMGVCAVGLIVVLTVAGTLAYLSTTSNMIKNTFTATGGISLGLVEENYNVDSSGNVIDNTKPNPKDFHPGVSYAKDPTLYNTTGEDDGSLEWVALRIDYKIENESKTYAEMTADDTDSITDATKEGIINGIIFDTTNWINIESGKYTNYDNTCKFDIWVYKYPLLSTSAVTTTNTTWSIEDVPIASNATTNTERTTPLFNSITIKNQAQLVLNGYDMNALSGFDIFIQGGAIKHDDFEFSFGANDKELVGDDVTPATADDTAKSKTSYKIAEALVNLLYDKNPTT